MRYIITIIVAVVALSAAGQGFETFKKGKFMGLRRDDGTVVVAPDRYKFIGRIVDKYTWVNVGGKKNQKSFPNGGKWGVIDSTGREVCPPLFEYVAACRNDYVAVNVGGVVRGAVVYGGTWGLYDLKSGRMTIEPVYTMVSAVNEYGRLWVCKDGGMSYKIMGDTIRGDKNKMVDFEPSFEYVTEYPLNLTLCNVVNRGVWSLVDVDGQRMTTRDYRMVFDFIKGYALVISTSGKFGYINREGRETVPAEYTLIAMSNNGRCSWARKTRQSRVGLIDITNGREITDEVFDSVGTSFFGAVAWVKLGGMYCLVDTAGTQLTQPAYRNVTPFVNGVALVLSRDRKIGAVNSSGEEIVRTMFTQSPSMFGEGSQFRTSGNLLMSWFVHPQTGVIWVDQNGKVLERNAKIQYKINDVVPEALWDY